MIGLIIVLTGIFAIHGVWQFHHPAFGLTKMLQFSPINAANALPEIRENPIYVHPFEAGYDGQYYAQFALRPSLQDPALETAVDIPSMRARRILTSWVAAFIGMGDAHRTLDAYAWINVVCWALWGLILLRLIPPKSVWHAIAWAGLMLSAGVITSVVCALTDLPAILLLTAAMLALQNGWFKSTAGLLMAACLTRETAVLSGVTFFQIPTWRRRIMLGAAVLIPLALWFWYVRVTFIPDAGSLSNFALPLSALTGKLTTVFSEVRASPDDLTLWAGLGATVAVVVQAGWLLARPQIKNLWWQMGIGYVALLLILGPPTFEGFPGAITRILLPLHLAFSMLALQSRLRGVLLTFGNLSVVAGVLFMGHNVNDPRELGSDSSEHGPVIIRTAGGWFDVERTHSQTWAWSEGGGDLWIKRFTESNAPAPVGIRFVLFGGVRNEVTIHQGPKLLWRGFIKNEDTVVTLDSINLDARGETKLTLFTEGPFYIEAGSGRQLAFAVYDVKFLTP
ncbi:MAG: hypothetical protein SynsKO_19490 [Synoicihabitans sp.]